jgi:hypothetical protein
LNLEQALERFDAVEANLIRLEGVWSQMQDLIPQGIALEGNSPIARRYRELARAYADILKGLPPIGGYGITARLYDLDAIAMGRLDAKEVGEIGAELSFEEEIEEPTRQIDAYRFHLTKARRELVRGRLSEVINTIDSLVAELKLRTPKEREPMEDEAWDRVKSLFSEIERLAGSHVPREGRWREMRRHLAWSQGVDLHDIADHDWPSVKASLSTNLYSELEPVPVEVDDLATLVASKPTGPVTTKLQWSAITDEDFERLLFNIMKLFGNGRLDPVEG